MSVAEEQRIRTVYRARDRAAKADLYAWHRPEVRYQSAVVEACWADLLWRAFGGDIHEKTIVDVGCGVGSQLRQLIEWGAAPKNLVGVELLEDRLDEAARRSPRDVSWHLGALDTLESPVHFDLIIASTVFSSILDDNARRELASIIWRRVRPGGWVFVFDFRYNNPRNQDVRKVTRRELRALWPDGAGIFKTILLAPPLARRIVPMSRILADLLSLLMPFTRSHFIYAVKKAECNSTVDSI